MLPLLLKLLLVQLVQLLLLKLQVCKRIAPLGWVLELLLRLVLLLEWQNGRQIVL